MKPATNDTWWPAWLKNYQRQWFVGDLSAGLIVTVMLIPQSLAYALLAGLPPEIGLYASILPLIVYALLGTSMTLSVGPVAVISFMTATALAPLAIAGSAEYILLAGHLALLSGLILVVFGILRLGFLAYFLSHPVINGFIGGASLLIALGQIKHILGISAEGVTVVELSASLFSQLADFNSVSLIIGITAMLILLLSRQWLASGLIWAGLSSTLAELLNKAAPMFVVIVATAISLVLDLEHREGLKVVGDIVVQMPSLGGALPSSSQFSALLLPALLIGLVGFVESISVAQSLALKRRQRIQPDRELLALGAANVASAVSGGYPVTGGFSRSAVNFAAGANTPLAGVISAILMLGVVVGLTDLFRTLPYAVLAATIIVAVLSMVDIKAFYRTWHYDRADGIAMLATAISVMLLGIEEGIVLGIVLSLSSFVWRSSRPHVAVVGRVPGTQHFRNLKRHHVETLAGVVALRIDESLFFGNAHVIEDQTIAALADYDQASHLILIFSAVNRIDTTALEMLANLNRSLKDNGIVLHLAEVKGPIMDKLKQNPFLKELSGRVFLSVNEAYEELAIQTNASSFDQAP